MSSLKITMHVLSTVIRLSVVEMKYLFYHITIFAKRVTVDDCRVCARARWRAGRSSEVERSLMVRWVVGSILHGVDPLSYFSLQPVLHDWCNKGRGMWDGAYKRTLAVNR